MELPSTQKGGLPIKRALAGGGVWPHPPRREESPARPLLFIGRAPPALFFNKKKGAKTVDGKGWGSGLGDFFGKPGQEGGFFGKKIKKKNKFVFSPQNTIKI